MSEWADICEREMNAISEASVILLNEQLALGGAATPEWQKARRAELYREALDAAGLDIVEVEHPRARGTVEECEREMRRLTNGERGCANPAEHEDAVTVTVHTRPAMAWIAQQWHVITSVDLVRPVRGTVVTRCGLTAVNPKCRVAYSTTKRPPGPECEECVSLPPFWP